MEERKISLLDLFVEVLLHWRGMIAWMVVGGVLLGAFSYVNSYRAIKEQEVALQEEDLEKENVEDVLSEQQKNNIRIVLDKEKYIEMLQQYVKNSVLMKVDATKVPQTYVTFRVNTENAEESASIEQIYEDTIFNGFFQWLAGKTIDATDSTRIHELITIQRSSEQKFEGGDSFCVKIVHITEEECIQLANQLISYMTEQQERLSEVIGEHTIEVINQSFSYAFDIDLLNYQHGKESEMTSAIATVNQLKEDFLPEEENHYAILADENFTDFVTKPSNDTIENTVMISASINIKLVVVGMFFLAVIYVFYVFIKFLLNNRICSYDKMEDICGIPQLASAICDSTKKKAFGFVDRWILQIRNRNKRFFSEDKAIALAAASIKIQAKRENLEEVYCVGCEIKGKTLKVAKDIQEMLGKAGITVIILNNILYSQESMEGLQNAQGVFLLETVGITLYDEIIKEVELLKRQQIKILGAITVE